LSLLRHVLNVYNREHDDEKIIVPSFDGLIKRVAHGGRALDAEERKKVWAHYPIYDQPGSKARLEKRRGEEVRVS
jgi:hypothetical protein